ncbi:MAG: CU044_2847 family protein [Cyanobacteria bacterium P01_D01_bin.50]
MEQRTEIIPVKISENLIVMVEAKSLGGEEDVSSKILDFKPVTDAIEGLTGTIANTVNKVKPDKATVELSLEVGVESGKLTTLLVNGSGKGNLKLTLEWGN